MDLLKKYSDLRRKRYADAAAGRIKLRNGKVKGNPFFNDGFRLREAIRRLVSGFRRTEVCKQLGIVDEQLNRWLKDERALEYIHHLEKQREKEIGSGYKLVLERDQQLLEKAEDAIERKKERALEVGFETLINLAQDEQINPKYRLDSAKHLTGIGGMVPEIKLNKTSRSLQVHASAKEMNQHLEDKMKRRFERALEHKEKMEQVEVIEAEVEEGENGAV